MSNSSWAFYSPRQDGRSGDPILATAAPMGGHVRLRLDWTENGQAGFASAGLPEVEVRKLANALQAWLGEQADKRAEEAAKKASGP